MSAMEHAYGVPRSGRRPGIGRDDSRQERERDYVKEVHPRKRAYDSHFRHRSSH